MSWRYKLKGLAPDESIYPFAAFVIYNVHFAKGGKQPRSGCSARPGASRPTSAFCTSCTGDDSNIYHEIYINEKLRGRDLVAASQARPKA